MLLCLQDGSFKDEVVVSVATGLVSVTSRASMAVLVVGGVVSPKPCRFTWSLTQMVQNAPENRGGSSPGSWC